MPRSRRTLSGVRSVERVELLALDVYQRANGRPVTLAMVADRHIIAVGSPEELRQSPDPNVQQFLNAMTIDGPRAA